MGQHKEPITTVAHEWSLSRYKSREERALDLLRCLNEDQLPKGFSVHRLPVDMHEDIGDLRARRFLEFEDELVLTPEAKRLFFLAEDLIEIFAAKANLLDLDFERAQLAVLEMPGPYGALPRLVFDAWQRDLVNEEDWKKTILRTSHISRAEKEALRILNIFWSFDGQGVLALPFENSVDRLVADALVSHDVLHLGCLSQPGRQGFVFQQVFTITKKGARWSNDPFSYVLRELHAIFVSFLEAES